MSFTNSSFAVRLKRCDFPSTLYFSLCPDSATLPSDVNRVNDCSTDDGEDAEEKARLICQVLELQNTLDGRIVCDSVNEEFHRKTGYIHFYQFQIIFDIKAAKI